MRTRSGSASPRPGPGPKKFRTVVPVRATISPPWCCPVEPGFDGHLAAARLVGEVQLAGPVGERIEHRPGPPAAVPEGQARGICRAELEFVAELPPPVAEREPRELDLGTGVAGQPDLAVDAPVLPPDDEPLGLDRRGRFGAECPAGHQGDRPEEGQRPRSPPDPGLTAEVARFPSQLFHPLGQGVDHARSIRAFVRPSVGRERARTTPVRGVRPRLVRDEDAGQRGGSFPAHRSDGRELTPAGSTDPGFEIERKGPGPPARSR